MMCNCGPGYGCGQYGCYRMRARASKSYKPGTLRSRLVNYEDGDEGEIVPQYPDFDDSLRYHNVITTSHVYFRENWNCQKFNSKTMFKKSRSRNRLPSSKSRPLTELDEHTALARASPTAADLPNIADTFRVRTIYLMKKLSTVCSLQRCNAIFYCTILYERSHQRSLPLIIVLCIVLS